MHTNGTPRMPASAEPMEALQELHRVLAQAGGARGRATSPAHGPVEPRPLSSPGGQRRAAPAAALGLLPPLPRPPGRRLHAPSCTSPTTTPRPPASPAMRLAPTPTSSSRSPWTSCSPRPARLLRIKDVHDRLHEKTTEINRINKRLQQAYKQIDQELELAHRIQSSFLPQTMPEAPGSRFAVHYQPVRPGWRRLLRCLSSR